MTFTAPVPAKNMRQKPLCGSVLVTPTDYCAYVTNNKKGKEPNPNCVFIVNWETWGSLAGGLITGSTKRTFRAVRSKPIVRGLDYHRISVADNLPQLLFLF